MKNKNCFCLKILFQFSEHSKATMLQMLHKCPDRIKQKIYVLNYKSFLCKIFGEKKQKKKNKKTNLTYTLHEKKKTMSHAMAGKM